MSSFVLPVSILGLADDHLRPSKQLDVLCLCLYEDAFGMKRRLEGVEGCGHCVGVCGDGLSSWGRGPACASIGFGFGLVCCVMMVAMSAHHWPFGRFMLVELHCRHSLRCSSFISGPSRPCRHIVSSTTSSDRTEPCWTCRSSSRRSKCSGISST